MKNHDNRRLMEYEKVQTPEHALAWQKRLRKSFAEHLDGFPERTPLNVRTVGTIDGEGYRIEKLIYESQPQHYVTAVLFLPDSKPPYLMGIDDHITESDVETHPAQHWPVVAMRFTRLKIGN